MAHFHNQLMGTLKRIKQEPLICSKLKSSGEVNQNQNDRFPDTMYVHADPQNFEGSYNDTMTKNHGNTRSDGSNLSNMVLNPYTGAWESHPNEGEIKYRSNERMEESVSLKNNSDDQFNITYNAENLSHDLNVYLDQPDTTPMAKSKDTSTKIEKLEDSLGWFSVLPKKVIMHILSFIPANSRFNFVPLVCKGFYCISKEMKNLTSLNVVFASAPTVKNIQVQLTMETIKTARNLKQLKISDSPHQTANEMTILLQTVAASCPNLQEIEICAADEDTTMSFPDCEPLVKLKQITKFVPWMEFDPDEKEHMDIISPAFLSNLFKLELNIVPQRRMHEAKLWELLMKLVVDGNNLRELNLTLVFSHYARINKRLRVFRRMNLANAISSSSWHNIHSLSITSCYLLNDKCIEAISLKCSTLRFLNIAFCKNVSDVGLEAVVQNCAEISRINCVGTKVTIEFVTKCQSPTLKITQEPKQLDESFSSAGFDDPDEHWKREEKQGSSPLMAYLEP